MITFITYTITHQQQQKHCSLTSRWGKCKLNLLGLTSGSQRPGQAGTTGQLFFSKCGDPPKGCECKFEAPKGKCILVLMSIFSLYSSHTIRFIEMVKMLVTFFSFLIFHYNNMVWYFTTYLLHVSHPRLYSLSTSVLKWSSFASSVILFKIQQK